MTQRLERGYFSLDPAHADAFTFDATGRMSAVSSTLAGQSRSDVFTYSALGAVLSATPTGAGAQTEYCGRDPLGSIVARSVAAGTWAGTFTHQYQSHTTRVSRILGDPAHNGGLVSDSTSVVYDNAGRVLTRDHHADVVHDGNRVRQAGLGAPAGAARQCLCRRRETLSVDSGDDERPAWPPSIPRGRLPTRQWAVG